MMKRLGLALAFLLAGGGFTASFSQGIRMAAIKSQLDRDTILTGDQIYYTLLVRGARGVEFLLPQVSDTLGGGVELLEAPRVDTILTGTDITIAVRYLVTAFDSGLHVLPNLQVVASLNGRSDSLLANGPALFVQPIPRTREPQAIYDIKPPIREPITLAEIAPWVGLAIALIAAGGFLIMYLEHRKKNKPFLGLFKPAEPPHLIALRELGRMRDERLWNTDNHKLYYTHLTDTLRVYLEGRFGINAPEQTSSEILSALKAVDYPFNGLKEQLQELLWVADLVKFAKHTPSAAENETNLCFAFDFVNRTRPGEDEKGEADDASAAAQETIDEQKTLS